MGMRWLVVVVLALAGACASQQALRETDQRMDEIALRVAAVENTSQRLATAQPEQARAQAETIARLQTELEQARARIAQLEARLVALERRVDQGDEQLRAAAREILDRFNELAAKVNELEAAQMRWRVEPPRPVVRRRSPPASAPDAEVDSPPTRQCCKVCTKGIPCGNTCIAAGKTCHKGPGCAC